MTYSYVNGDLLVSTDAESSNSVTRGGVHRLGSLAKLLKNLGGSGQSITTLTNATVDDHLRHGDLLHDVLFCHLQLLLLSHKSTNACRPDSMAIHFDSPRFTVRFHFYARNRVGVRAVRDAYELIDFTCVTCKKVRLICGGPKAVFRGLCFTSN